MAVNFAKLVIEQLHESIDLEIIDDYPTGEYDDDGDEYIIPGVRSLLNKLNLEKIDVVESDNLLHQLLLKCFPDKSKVVVAKEIMKRYMQR